MNTLKKILLTVLVTTASIGIALSVSGPVRADDEGEKLKELERQIQEYTSKITELQSQANTLSGQIAQYNAEIRLAELRINQTEENIILLGGRIDQLSVSMGDLQTAFNSRAVETYRMTRLSNSAALIFSAPDVTEAVSRLHYLHRIQEADRTLLARLQKAHDTYTEKKDELTELQKVLGAQKEQLDTQKNAKNYLLTVTKNDEKQYQSLLAQVRAEFEAIQAIIAGRGDESEVGSVNAGERIAAIIVGPSCNSSGGHLHFIVSADGVAQNPFNHLKSGVEIQNCTGAGECSAADPANPSGSWEWPINPPIRFTQGYGRTWAVDNTWVGRVYNFHNGIDIISNNPEVRAVQPGVLYRGSYTGSGGCRLRYVRVDHTDSNIDTFYLHVNY